MRSFVAPGLVGLVAGVCTWVVLSIGRTNTVVAVVAISLVGSLCFIIGKLDSLVIDPR